MQAVGILTLCLYASVLSVKYPRQVDAKEYKITIAFNMFHRIKLISSHSNMW